jgi:hypothetical protein
VLHNTAIETSSDLGRNSDAYVEAEGTLAMKLSVWFLAFTERIHDDLDVERKVFLRRHIEK